MTLPTPYDKFSKKVDACYVVEAVKDVMKVCHKGATVVIESTVSPGTIDKFVRPVIEENGFTIGQDINLVHAPERIIPGNMVWYEQLGGGDSPLADAIIDRIAHDSYRINITSIDTEHDRSMREVYGLDKELRE